MIRVAVLAAVVTSTVVAVLVVLGAVTGAVKRAGAAIGAVKARSVRAQRRARTENEVLEFGADISRISHGPWKGL